MGRNTFVRGVCSRIFIGKELLTFLWQNKLWWIIPIALTFVLLGILIVFAQNPAVAPFIYTLF